MPVKEYAISSLDEVPASVIDFLSNLPGDPDEPGIGWTTRQTEYGCAVKRPLFINSTKYADHHQADLTPDDLAEWHIESSTVEIGLGINVIELRATPWDEALNDNLGFVYMTSPLIETPAGSPFAYQSHVPSKLTLIGETVPEPFLAGVVEFRTNKVRHFYLGSLKREGRYKSGEAASTCIFHSIRNDIWYPVRSWESATPLFRGMQAQWREIRGFTVPTSLVNYNGTFINNDYTASNVNNAGTSNVEGRVIGGWKDGPNDLLAGYGYSLFSGEQPVFPFLLFHVEGTEGQQRYRPIGTPVGCYNVNVQNITPGADVETGNVRYRVFPVCQKSEKSQVEHPTDGRSHVFSDEETSQYYGHAYRVERTN